MRTNLLFTINIMSEKTHGICRKSCFANGSIKAPVSFYVNKNPFFQRMWYIFCTPALILDCWEKNRYRERQRIKKEKMIYNENSCSAMSCISFKQVFVLSSIFALKVPSCISRDTFFLQQNKFYVAQNQIQHPIKSNSQVFHSVLLIQKVHCIGSSANS